MKKLLSLTLVLLMLTGLMCSAALAGDVYALNEETLTLEQGPIWYFLYFDESDEGVHPLNPTPMWGDNWQFSENPQGDNVYHSICEWDGIQAMPGTWMGKHIDIVVAFKAPKDGTVTIEPMEFVIKDDGNEHPNYFVAIAFTKADGETTTQLFPINADENFAETPVTTEAITLDVEEEDFIFFSIHATDDGGAAVSVMPVITYAD